MKIKVNTKKPVKIGGKAYQHGHHIIADSLAHSAEVKALFAKDALTVVPRSDGEARLQKDHDAQASASAQAMRKSAKKE